MLKVRCLASDLWQIQMSRHIWRKHRALHSWILLCRYKVLYWGPSEATGKLPVCRGPGCCCWGSTHHPQLELKWSWERREAENIPQGSSLHRERESKRSTCLSLPIQQLFWSFNTPFWLGSIPSWEGSHSLVLYLIVRQNFQNFFIHSHIIPSPDASVTVAGYHHQEKMSIQYMEKQECLWRTKASPSAECALCGRFLLVVMDHHLHQSTRKRANRKRSNGAMYQALKSMYN